MLHVVVLLLMLCVTYVYLHFSVRKRISLEKHAIITGCGNGLGYHLMKQLILKGIFVHGIDIDDSSFAELEKMHGIKCQLYKNDCADRESFRSLILNILSRSEISLIINNAGIVYPSSSFDFDEHLIEKSFQVNVFPHFILNKLAISHHFQSHRSYSLNIVTIASTVGHFGASFACSYSATKHALVGYHESLRRELKNELKTKYSPVHTLIVCPYTLDTKMFKAAAPAKWPFNYLIPIQNVQYVCTRIIDALERRKEELYFPCYMKWLPLIIRIAPCYWSDIIFNFSGGNHSLHPMLHKSISKS